ncbi:MAG TPA: acyl-CoA dehydrogenase family protein, partial [candidate division Zixibacteria bacterium]|nr:acyl-CoA dehydrogenase family protein [candidate division Zixibacteria bacterium]
MNRNIDPRQQAVRDQVKQFAEKEIYPITRELDQMPEPRRFPTELYRKIGAAGFIGYAMPKELGGSGKSHLEYITLVEELCYHDPAVGLLCAVGELATHPIIHFASDQQKKKYVPDCARAARIPAFVLTEPNAGSDAANQQTEAVEGDGGFILNGEKIFIMHGDAADLAVVFCKVKDKPKLSAFIIDDLKQPGWQARTLRQKMGMRAATTGGIHLKNVFVPKENLLGEFGKGFRYAMTTLDSARVGVAAQGVGIAQRMLDEAVAYAKKREAFGAPIAKLQAIQWMIADMATRLAAARHLTYHAAKLQDAGESFGLEASMAKLYCSET